VKWETGWVAPHLLHIQSVADVELFGITTGNHSLTADMTCTLDANGSHSIFLSGAGAEVGDYSITLARLNSTNR
jgi:hypothetical protein